MNKLRYIKDYPVKLIAIACVVLAIAVLASIPTFASAQGRGNNSSCPRAFGHLIASGWLKKNSAPNIAEDCNLPPGIAKLLGIGGGDEDEDTISPVISDLSVSHTDMSVEVSWMTDEDADSKLFVSESSPVDTGATSTISVSDGSDVVSHELEASGLSPDTVYFGFVRSTDSSGNTTSSSEFSFATDESPDVGPPVISSVVISDIGEASAHVTWDTDESATSKVFYGTTTPLDTEAVSTGMESSGLLVVNHDLLLSGLEASTTYYVIIESEDSSGNATTSSEFSFTTDEELDVISPIISSIFSVVGTSSATVSWMTDEDADSALFYGTTTPLDTEATSTVVVEDSTLETLHEMFLDGLESAVTYFLKIRSSDTESNTSFSGEFSFTTSE